MAEKTIIKTDKAPAAVGPYSQGVVLSDFKTLVFPSGQLGLIPGESPPKFAEGGVEAQAKQALNNLKAVLEAGGSGMDKLVKVWVYLNDMDDFKAVNEVYETFFGGEPPARAAFAVKKLPLGGLVEVDGIAYVD